MAFSFVLARPKPQRTTEGTPRLLPHCGRAERHFEHPALYWTRGDKLGHWVKQDVAIAPYSRLLKKERDDDHGFSHGNRTAGH
jgi:hypothetical protein